MTTDKEREAFETHARPKWRHPEDFDQRIGAKHLYNNYEVQAAWDAWQARAALQQADEQDKRDTERLDFLDCNKRFRMGWEVRVAPAGNIGITSVAMGGKPIREAIDAAMAKGEAQ